MITTLCKIPDQNTNQINRPMNTTEDQIFDNKLYVKYQTRIRIRLTDQMNTTETHRENWNSRDPAMEPDEKNDLPARSGRLNDGRKATHAPARGLRPAAAGGA